MSDDIHLFTPIHLGGLLLPNRLVMAPMTRNRADRQGRATPLMATYYAQRADAGLLIAEATSVSPQGVGYPLTPSLFDEAQAAAWREVTDAVHARGGRIFVQLQHCGRISHPSLQVDHALPVAPSALQPEGSTVTYDGLQAFVTPRAMEAADIRLAVDQFRRAARLAKTAGFDGIELHGANGYLIDQFLRDASNQRSDDYGGTAPNRLRFLLEVLDAVTETWSPQEVGVRLSPEGTFNSMSDSAPQRHFSYFVSQLNTRRLAYLHMIEEPSDTGSLAVDYGHLRGTFNGRYIANSGYDRPRAQAALQSGAADLISFGKPYLANPDLARRLRDGLPLTAPDPSTFYTGAERGYTDYPFAS